MGVQTPCAWAVATWAMPRAPLQPLYSCGRKKKYEQANDWGWTSLHPQGETELIHMDVHLLSCSWVTFSAGTCYHVCFWDRLWRKLGCSTGNSTEEPLPRLPEGLVWHMWHLSFGSPVKSLPSFPQSHYHTRLYHSSNLTIKYKISPNYTNKKVRKWAIFSLFWIQGLI